MARADVRNARVVHLIENGKVAVDTAISIISTYWMNIFKFWNKNFVEVITGHVFMLSNARFLDYNRKSLTFSFMNFIIGNDRWIDNSVGFSSRRFFLAVSDFLKKNFVEKIKRNVVMMFILQFGNIY